MADTMTEAQFVSTFWGMAEAQSEKATNIMVHIAPDMFQDQGFSKAYKVLREAYAKGQNLGDFVIQAEVVNAVGQQWGEQIFVSRNDQKDLRQYAAKILLNFRARKQLDLLRDAVTKTEMLIASGKDGNAAKLSDSMLADLIRLHNSSTGGRTPQTKSEYTQAELEKIDRKSDGRGIWLPYSKLHQEIGNIIAGDTIGIAAYSNGGKSTTLANLFKHFVINDNPCIVFPTEMRERWLSRAYACHARVPQMIAEREDWENATEEQKVAYRMAVQDLERCPWEIVNRANITVEEIIARATVIRRRWPGKTVIVMVDHMHRLDYHGSDADLMAGEATKRLRDWAAEDQEGGIILVLLYQPRKPSDEIELYKPVRGDQIKGKSSIWNELDILISPYRRWVKIVPGWERNPGLRTAWGTPVCMYDSKHIHLPSFTKPGDAEGKLDDEHAYIKIAKRRVGGEGPTVMLNMESPTGYIYELTSERKGLIAL